VKPVAVIAHAGKSIEGGLPELRRTLARHGIADPLWVEVPKSKKAPQQVKRLLDKGAEHFFVWGGDGMALLIASLCAEGTSRIGNVGQIDRGYERIDERLLALGARIERVEA
jgi:hypothetical protein